MKSNKSKRSALWLCMTLGVSAAAQADLIIGVAGPYSGASASYAPQVMSPRAIPFIHTLAFKRWLLRSPVPVKTIRFKPAHGSRRTRSRPSWAPRAGTKRVT